jgi:signal peptidase I
LKGSTARNTRPPSDGAPAGTVGKAGKGEPENWAWEWVKSIAVAVVLFLVIRTFLVQAFTIPSGSMEDTLLVGDYLMANNAIYGTPVPLLGFRTPAFREPRHSDVVVFRPTYNVPVIDVVKRVIGEPGDTVQMVDRVVYRNGQPLDEPYVEPTYLPDEPIPFSSREVMLQPGLNPQSYGYHWHVATMPEGVDREAYRPTRDNWGPLIVPERHYLLLGDNRDQSLDSRYMGFIPREEVKGKAMFIYYSIEPRGDRPFPRLLTAARWGRIGQMIR